MSEISAIILAAGQGTRMKSSKPKVLHEICSVPMLECVYRAAESAGVSNIITVVGHGAQEVKNFLGDERLYAEQKQQLGTGHAVMCAMPQLEDGGCCLVLSGDVPLITKETLENAMKYHMKNRLAATVITAEVENPYGYGRIIRDEKLNVNFIVEEKDTTPAQRQVNEINSGLYCFDTGLLRAALTEVTPKNAQGEYYLTDTIAILLKNGYNVGAFKLSDNLEIMGVNNRIQLAQADKIMRKRINEYHMLEGVSIIDPDATYIGFNVKIGRDTVVYPGSSIESGSVIGENCKIGPGSTIKNCRIGNNTECISSVVTDSEIGENVHIGPFAYIRPGCRVGNNIKVGDFVELKNAVIDDGTKISHLTYVGDSDVGKNVNFGCGTVTVNYDSKKKHRTVIGDNAFIGCNTNLVAPVTVKKGAYTAAGSTITDEVPENSLAVARARQVNKENWRLKKEF